MLLTVGQKVIESSVSDYSGAYILLTGNNTVTRTVAVPADSPAGTEPQRKQALDAATSGSLWGFKKDEIDNNANVTNDDNSPSFKYKASNISNTEADGIKEGVKIAVPLKYFSNFWRSLEMPLINCKTEVSLEWIENCVLTTAAIGDNANVTGAEVQLLK